MIHAQSRTAAVPKRAYRVSLDTLLALLMSSLLLCAMSGCQTLTPPGQPDATEVRHVQVDGVDLAYVEAGRGTPVVFVHGSAGDWRIWANQRPAVAARYRFIAYSRRYHWPNVAPTNGSEYSVAVHAKDLAGFIRAIHGGPVHLVSTSYGSQVAMLVALDNPELVRSITLSEPGLGNLLPDTPEAKAQAGEFGKSFAPVREAIKAGNSLAAVQLMVDAALGVAGSAASLSEREREVMVANASTIGPQMTSTSRVTFSCARLSTLKAPALVVGGDASPGFMKLTNDAMAKCLPSSTMKVVVPNSRHLSHSMNPGFYNETLMTFLARN